ncbi:hypothetical protein AGMMS49944_03690 [Spirochaetia bacterium]|nr:hypothetical protein AGMMS49944_03690 [Spirochaetia bacterium]
MAAFLKQKGDMYRWVDFTWNPVQGKCQHDCAYCYIKRIAQRFRGDDDFGAPHLFDTPLNIRQNGAGKTVFVCSSCDLFASNIPESWIAWVIRQANKYPENTWLWNTKNPQRAVNLPRFDSRFPDYPKNSILCATIETNCWFDCMGKAPHPDQRFKGLEEWEGRKMVTIEPIMKFAISPFVERLHWIRPEQVNLGANSGNVELPEPSREDIEKLVYKLSRFTKVHLKKNLRRILPEHDLYSEGA